MSTFRRSSLRVRLLLLVLLALTPALALILHSAVTQQLEAGGEGARATLFRSFALIGLVATSALAAAWFGSEVFVLRPARALLRATRRLGAGDLAARSGAPYDTGELGELARAFDQMAESLEQGEIQLRVADARYRTLVERLPVITYAALVEDGLETLYVSPQVSSLLGLPEAEFEQRPHRWEDLLHPDDRERVLSELGTAWDERKQFESEYRLLLPGERVVWCHDEASVVTDEDGVPIFLQGVVLDITDRKLAEAAVERNALYDSLTGLPNRALLLDRVRQTISTAAAERRSFALLVMNLDRFKEINSTLGHEWGDDILQQVSDRLRHDLQPTETAARLGADGFAILLPGASNEVMATVAAGRLLRILDEPFILDAQAYLAEARIGVALYPDHGDLAETLLRRAEIAMYLAKRTESRYAIYAPEHDLFSTSRLRLIGELRSSIEQDALQLYYQPKVALESGELTSVEALVRWDHPDRGLVSPQEFIPLAEHTGLINSLSMWALRAGLRQCREWKTSGLTIPVAVNLSALNLHDPRLPDRIEDLLATSQSSADCLLLEMTESAIMADLDRSAEILRRLRDMGLHLSIDDFGTGYSSLSYLRRLPVDEIKIDQSFIKEMARNEHDAAIFRSIIDLAHSLRLRVIAEGVEDQETWNLLSQLGCDVAQGYLISRPLPPAGLVQWISETRSAALHSRQV